MDAEVSVRPARAEDAEALAEVYIESAEHHMRLDPSIYAHPDLDKMISRYQERVASGDPDSEIVVAERKGRVIGFVDIQLRRPDGHPRMIRDAVSAEVDIAVLDDWRGRGVGTRLMDAAEDWAVEHGADLVTVSVHVANVDAVRFYQDHRGYRTNGLFLAKRPSRERPEA